MFRLLPYLICALVFSLAPHLQAQNYVITSAGDTLRGTFVDNTAKSIFFNVTFIPKGRETAVTFGPADLRGFTSSHLGTYYSTLFLPSTAGKLQKTEYFVKPLVQGEVELYLFVSRRTAGTGTDQLYRYTPMYLIIEDGDITMVRTKKQFDELIAEAADCPAVKKNYRLTDYGVMRFVDDRASCNATQTETMLNPEVAPDRGIHFFAEGGHFSFSPTAGESNRIFTGFTFEDNSRTDFGLGISYYLKPRLEGRLLWTYARYVHLASRLDGASVISTIRVSQQFMVPSLQFRYYIPLLGGKLFPMAGVQYARYIAGTYGDPRLGEPNDNMIQLTTGAGIQYQVGPVAAYVEFRYHPSEFGQAGQLHRYQESGVVFGLRL